MKQDLRSMRALLVVVIAVVFSQFAEAHTTLDLSGENVTQRCTLVAQRQGTISAYGCVAEDDLVIRVVAMDLPGSPFRFPNTLLGDAVMMDLGELSMLLFGVIGSKDLWSKVFFSLFTYQGLHAAFSKRTVRFEYQQELHGTSAKLFRGASISNVRPPVAVYFFPPRTIEGSGGYTHCDIGGRSHPTPLCGGAQSASYLPEWLESLFVMTPVRSRHQFVHHFHDSDVQTVALSSLCTLEGPAATHWCLEVWRNIDSPLASSSMDITVTKEDALDRSFLYGVVLFILLLLLRPIVVASVALQVIAAGCFGVLFLLVFLLYYLAKDLMNSRLGKAGVVGAFSVGGFAALSYGVANVFFGLLIDTLLTNSLLQVGIVVSGVLTAVFSYIWLQAQLRNATVAFFWIALVTMFVGGIVYNREGTLVVTCHYLFAKMWWRWLPCSIKMLWFLWFPFRFGGKKRSKQTFVPPVSQVDAQFSEDTDVSARLSATWPLEESEPLDADELPEEAFAGVSSILSSSCSKFRGTSGEKKNQFELQGRVHTTAALQQLAEYYANHAPEYASKLSDPNGMARFAGI